MICELYWSNKMRIFKPFTKHIKFQLHQNEVYIIGLSAVDNTFKYTIIK